MSLNRTPVTSRRFTPLLAVLGILLGFYTFTYSARIESGDTLTLFNAVASLVHYGDMQLDLTAADNPPDPATATPAQPLHPADVEPLQLILPAPLYALAQHLTGIGLIHAVWLFNIINSLLIVAVLYVYVLTLGYAERTAVAASLLLGLATIIWPYSKTFFREPLAALLILLSALGIERWRHSHYRSVPFFLLSVIALAGALLTKEAAIFALPALIVLVMPERAWPPLAQRLLLFTVTVVLIVIALLLIIPSIFASSLDLSTVYANLAPLLRRTPDQIRTAHIALHTYLLSVGGSLWGTSPITLLALPGLWLLLRAGRYRYAILTLLMVFGFAAAYALLRGAHWFGGLSWPPRFLLPVIPFLLLAALPALDRLVTASLPRWLYPPAIALLLYSLWIQVVAVSLPWTLYVTVLPSEANGLGEWGGGLNDLRYLRWVLLPQLWGRADYDFAWARMNVALWPLISLIIALISVFWLWRSLRMQSFRVLPARLQRFAWALIPLVLIALFYLGLRAIYPDVLYAGGNPSLHNARQQLVALSDANDVLMLSDDEYQKFFMNYAAASHPRVVTLPDPPGEQPSPEQPPAVTSVNPDALLIKSTVALIHNLAQSRDNLWLLADFGPWHPWAVRPVERFMTTHYYPLRELPIEPPDPRVRLIEYSTINAPDPYAYRGPENITGVRFGDSIHLAGFTLPAGLTYKPGTVLPISLYWQALEPIPHNYTVAWFVASQSGQVLVQGYDAPPAWGFQPTSQWQTAVPLWDNRALRLPLDAPAGTYQLWIRLYQSDQPDMLLPVHGGEVRDFTLAVLPVEITIAP